jgi:hypothetical protein
MKKSQLLAIIDKAINEVLNEEESNIDVSNPTGLTAKQKETFIRQAQQSTGDRNLGTIKKPVSFVEEAELDEARRFGIADASKIQSLLDDIPSRPAKENAKKRIKQIIDAITKAGGRLTGGDIAKELGVIQPQINNLLKAMEAKGILNMEGGKAFATPLAPGETAPEEEPEMAGDYTDFFVGKGDVDKAFIPYFRDEPTSEEEPAIPTRTVSMAAAPKIGVWFDDHSDLIQAIIDKTKTATKRVGKLKENEEIGSGDFKRSALASKDWAKESLKTLIEELVSELVKVKQEDPAMFEKILVQLKQYKFGPTNSLSSYKEIIKQLNAADVEAKPVDAGDLELGDEEEEEDTLPEPIMERLQKLAKIK